MQNTGIFKTLSNPTMTRGIGTFKYYAFGSAINEMQYKSDTGGGYRYGFNTQEKDDEIAGEGNSYTAEFWQYDGRLGRRWNLDPKAQIYFSDYSVMGDNPILNIDLKGDKFIVGMNKESQDDVKSVISSKNQKYLKFDESTGEATLDFSSVKGKTQKKIDKKIDKLLKRDPGLKLVKNLIEAKKMVGNKEVDEVYYYETSNNRKININGKDYDEVLPYTSGQVIRDNSFVTNTSTTPIGGNYVHAKPLSTSGYDAAIFVSPGTLYDNVEITNENGVGTGNFSEQVIPRFKLIFHELNESYLRTHLKQEYSSAHPNAGGHGTYTKFIIK